MLFRSVTSSRGAFVALTAGLALTLTACGGSMVRPQDFIGVGGPVVATTTGPATVPGTTTTQPASVPGATTTNGSVPGAGNTPGATNPGTTNPGTTNPGTTNPGTTNPGGTNHPATGVKAASCAGFKNGPGITDKTITVATIADVSGAVANQFKSAHDAMNAYAAYFNTTYPGGICGRALKVQTYDSGLTATGSNSASKAACASAFAAVGSFSAFDSGGADATASCGQPDVRASAVEAARQQAPTTIQVMPLDTNHVFLQPWVWAKQKFGNAAIQHAAYVYLDAGASGTITGAIRKGTTAKLGYNWQKTIIVPVAGVPNWNAYANQLKSAGIKFVQTNLSSYTSKLKAAFDQADYHPVFMADGSSYGPQFISGPDGAIMQGVYAFTQTAMLEEASRTPELQLMIAWLQRTGGDAGNITAMQAWAAGMLFTKTALELGGRLTRPALLTALRKVHSFNGNGVLTPADPGSGTTGRCLTVVQISGGKFIRITPYPYTCGPLA